MGSGPTEVVFSLGANFEKLSNHEVFNYANGLAKVPRPWKRGRPKGSTNRVRKSQSNLEDEPTQLQFEFVNVTKQFKDIDTMSRARIRKHAKLHQARSRYQPMTSQSSEAEAIKPSASKAVYLFNLRQIPGVDPFCKTPVRLEPYMHDLLVHFSTTAWKRLYSLEVLAGCNPMAEYWLPLAFHDCALLHCLIGCADVYVSGYTTIKDKSRGLRHLTKAISIVNQRFIEEKDLMSIGTLSVIAGIALLEKGAGRHDHWRTHMQGLKQLVDLNGGLESLHSEPMILNKIYRADLYGSLDAAQVPYFDRPLPASSILSYGNSFRSIGFNLIHGRIGLNESLCNCLHHLEDAMLFWSGMDDPFLDTKQDRRDGNADRKDQTPTEAARVRYLLTDVQYTLSSARFTQNLGDSWENQVFELCRIVLILYSLTILNERPLSTAVGQQVTSTFKTILIDLKNHSHDNGQDSATGSWIRLPVDFYLWAIFLASNVTMTTSTESNTKDWLLLTFAELSSSNIGGIQGWHDMKSRLSRYLWVSSIHDPGLQWLWSETADMRQRQAVSAL